MTRFQKIVVALLTVNMLATVGLYLRLDSQELLLEKEVRSFDQTADRLRIGLRI